MSRYNILSFFVLSTPLLRREKNTLSLVDSVHAVRDKARNEQCVLVSVPVPSIPLAVRDDDAAAVRFGDSLFLS